MINWEIVIPIIPGIGSALFTFYVWKRQKHMEDSFSRSKSAYDKILNKEFEFYEKSDSIYAELIPGIHDIVDGITNAYVVQIELSERKELVHKHYGVMLNNILILKHILLIYQIYLPVDVYHANSAVSLKLQELLPSLDKEIHSLLNGNESEIDCSACRKALKEVLSACAYARTSNIGRLKDLANLKWRGGLNYGS